MKKLFFRLSFLFILSFLVSKGVFASTCDEANNSLFAKFSLPASKTEILFFGPEEEEEYSSFAILSSEPFEGISDWVAYELDGIKTFYWVENPLLLDHPGVLNQTRRFRRSPPINIDEYYESSEEVYPPTNVTKMLEEVALAEIVSISFGAGLSQGFLPTLEEIYRDLGLEKIPSLDYPTDKSLRALSLRMLKEPQKYLSQVKNLWSNIPGSSIEQTPSHVFLSCWIDGLKNNGKQVFVYTDNIDEIDKKCGIELSKGGKRLIKHRFVPIFRGQIFP